SHSVAEKRHSVLKKHPIVSERKEIVHHGDHHSKVIKAKRVEHISDLRKIHACLMKNLKFPSGKIILQNNQLEFFLQSDGDLSPRVKEQTGEFIYQRLLRAMTSQIYYFFDDAGYFVSFHSLNKLIKNRYGILTTPFANEVEENLKTYYEDKPNLWGDQIDSESEFLEHIQKLSFPKSSKLKKISEKEKLIISIYQCFYPVSAPVNVGEGQVPQFPPITFLCTYEKLGIITEDLFVQAAKSIAIEDIYMPYLQKLRILNFLRLFLASHLRKDEEITEPMLASIETMREFGYKIQKAEFTDLIYEIDHLLEQRKKSSLLNLDNCGWKTVYDVITLFLNDPLTGSKYTDCLTALSADLKYLAARVTVKLQPLALLKGKESDETALFYNQIVTFIVDQFIQIFERETAKQVPDVKFIRNRLNYFFTILTDLSFMLAKERDFLSSFSIYSALSIFELNQLMFSDDCKGTFSKTKKLKSLSENKFEKLQNLFSYDNNFRHLRDKMTACQSKNLFMVPFLGPTLSDLTHALDAFEIEFAHTSKKVINNEKFYKIATRIWDISLMLQQVKVHFKNQPVNLYTNMDEHLNKTAYDEEKLLKIYQKLNKLLFIKKMISSNTSNSKDS
ncbi:MAG TPA: RasGEF domain-containing protein, partial [Parachlamydiaceae bacterium]|nr:RasGEF domain-containing protein [Parachlamydiaceae bacterium]